MPGKTKKKPSAPLKEFVAKYTEKKTGTKDPGKALRIAFNRNPQKALDDNYVADDAVRAFLSFDYPTISQHVLKETLGKDWTTGTADEYSKWLKTLAAWDWPPGEEDAYEQPLCNAGGGMKAAYGAPKCQLKSVTPIPKGTDPVTSKRTVELEVLGEGFLPGATVECVNLDTDEVVVAGAVTFDKKSTFRCSLLRTTALLLPGNYRGRVLDDLGPSGSYAIERTKEGHLVPFTIP